MSITPLPTAPQRSDGPALFPVRADTWVAALDNWTTQVNAIAVTINGQAVAVNTNRANAESAAIAAAASAGSASTSAINASNSALSAQIFAAAAQSSLGIPSFASKAGYVLTVNESATDVEWRTPQGSQTAFETAIMFGV